MSDAPDQRAALVTGAAGGIGSAIAARLASDGFRVALADRDDAGLASLAGGLSNAAIPVVADVTVRSEVERMVQAVLDRWGRLDVLVNNAGRTRIGLFIEAPEEHWRELLEVDVLGVMRCTQVALPHMCHQKWGRVINIASDAARTGLPGQTVYAAAKGAIIAFTKSLAREVAGDNVLVNAVSPGPVNTPPLQRLFERQPDFARKLQEEIPLGRVAEVDDVAGMVSFLASEDARYITGQVLSVNGGWVTA